MKKDLSLIPYKIRVVQQMLPPDYLKRKSFAAWFIRQSQHDTELIPRSPDLTPPDFYLWGYLKSKVYKEDPKTVEDLKRKIEEEITSIDEETLRKVMKSTLKRMHECLEFGGDHLKCTIFKK